MRVEVISPLVETVPSTEEVLSARVIVTLSSPPTIGQKPIHSGDAVTLSFMIESEDVGRLHSSLSSRGIVLPYLPGGWCGL